MIGCTGSETFHVQERERLEAIIAAAAARASISATATAGSDSAQAEAIARLEDEQPDRSAVAAVEAVAEGVQALTLSKRPAVQQQQPVPQDQLATLTQPGALAAPSQQRMGLQEAVALVQAAERGRQARERVAALQLARRRDDARQRIRAAATVRFCSPTMDEASCPATAFLPSSPS